MEIFTTPFAFIKDKKGQVDHFLRTFNLKKEFENYNKKELKKTNFKEPHLHGVDIPSLLCFLKNKFDELELQIGTEIEMKQIQDLIDVLPPLRGKKQDVWFIFQKDAESFHPATCSPKNMNLTDEEMEEFDKLLDEEIERQRLFRNKDGN